MTGPIEGWDARPGGSPVPASAESAWTRPAPPKRQRRGIADVFEEAFKVWKRHFRPILLTHLVFQLPIVVLSFVPMVVSSGIAARLPRTTPPGRPFPLTEADIRAILDALPLFALSSLLLIGLTPILGALAMAGPSYIHGRARRGDEPTVRETFLALRRMLGPIIGYAFALLGLAVLIVVAFVVGVVVVLVLGRSAGMVGPAILLVMIATIVGVVAMVIALIRLSLAIPALVHERLGGVAALRRSWSLVRGSVLHTFVILLVVGFVVGFAPGIVASMVMPVGVDMSVGDLVPSLIPTVLIQLLAAAILGPLSPLVLTALYFDLAEEPRR